LNFRLGDLAELSGAELRGDAERTVNCVAAMDDAVEGSITFLANKKYRKFLSSTRASAVILRPEFLEECPVDALVSDNPHLAYARICAYMFPQPEPWAKQHPTSWIAETAVVDPSAYVGPNAVVEDNAQIGARVSIGPGCLVAEGACVGAGSKLVGNVTLCHGITIGERALIHPGAVIGSDGFGLARDDRMWVKVPQLGSVIIGDDVEIGANTTIDRGALGDTVIENGVKLDNQIQIAHNVHIGENTAIAACTGIAGSTRIGRNSTLGGGVGIAGHLELSDNVHFSGQTLVTKSFKEPGYYSGNLPAVPNSEWRKTIAHIRRLDKMVQRIRDLEKRVSDLTAEKTEGQEY